MNMILTSKCSECDYGNIVEIDKAHIMVRCRIKNKEYQYGEYVPCDHRKISINKTKGKDEQHE